MYRRGPSYMYGQREVRSEDGPRAAGERITGGKDLDFHAQQRRCSAHVDVPPVSCIQSSGHRVKLIGNGPHGSQAHYHVNGKPRYPGLRTISLLTTPFVYN